MRFLKSLTGDNVSLGGPAHLGELVSHEASSGKRSQRTESRFDPFLVP